MTTREASEARAQQNNPASEIPSLNYLYGVPAIAGRLFGPNVSDKEIRRTRNLIDRGLLRGVKKVGGRYFGASHDIALVSQS